MRLLELFKRKVKQRSMGSALIKGDNELLIGESGTEPIRSGGKVEVVPIDRLFDGAALIVVAGMIKVVVVVVVVFETTTDEVGVLPGTEVVGGSDSDSRGWLLWGWWGGKECWGVELLIVHGVQQVV